jgi:putative MATE family efflux protein
MGASAGVRRIGSSFTRIALGGSFSVLFLFVLNALFRGAGDATTAMRSLWLANAINIVLGPILIFGLGPVPAFGVTGAAAATVIGRSCGVLYQLSLFARRRGRLRLHWAHLRPQSRVLVGLLRLASTAALQMLLETTSWLGLVRILSTFGSAALAGYTIGMRVIIFVALPSLGFANAAATLVGQNLGAERPDRAERAVRYIGFYNFVFLSAIGLVLVLAPGSIVGFFTEEPDELAFAINCLRIHAVGMIASSYGMVLVQAFNGAGDTRTPTLLNVLCFWCFKIPLAYVLALRLGFGPNGVFASVAAGYTLLAVIAFALFRAGRWKHVQV